MVAALTRVETNLVVVKQIVYLHGVKTIIAFIFKEGNYTST